VRDDSRCSARLITILGFANPIARAVCRRVIVPASDELLDSRSLVSEHVVDGLIGW